MQLKCKFILVQNTLKSMYTKNVHEKLHHELDFNLVFIPLTTNSSKSLVKVSLPAGLLPHPLH